MIVNIANEIYASSNILEEVYRKVIFIISEILFIYHKTTNLE